MRSIRRSIETITVEGSRGLNTHFSESTSSIAMIRANVGSAFEALWDNRLRSLLTALGVIIGVAAVITSVTLTEGVSSLINGQITSLGTNVLSVDPGAPVTNGVPRPAGSDQTLTQKDVAIIKTIPNVKSVSPIIYVANVQANYGRQSINTQVEGVTAGFQAIQNWKLATGGWFSEQDTTSAFSGAVIGQSVAHALFGSNGNAVGQTIRIRDQLFHVIGVLQAEGTLGTTDADNVIFTPFTTALLRLNNSQYVSEIKVLVAGDTYLDSVQQQITFHLRLQHHIEVNNSPDFQVSSVKQLIQTAQQFTSVLAALLIGIAAISLTVGGIGIMNIMLVSVTERTREIGIRMALGAQQKDIRNQFLIEALALSAIGGTVGTLLGLLAGGLLTHTLGLPFVLSLSSILLACAVVTIVGIIFGLYPAIRASRLDPIVALRTE